MAALFNKPLINRESWGVLQADTGFLVLYRHCEHIWHLTDFNSLAVQRQSSWCIQ